MNSLDEAKLLVRAGRFQDALSALNGGAIERTRRTEADVLRAEMLERIGSYSAAQAQAEELLKARHLTPSERSACDQVVGRAHMMSGRYTSAVTCLQRAAVVAAAANDFSRACWAQMWLLVAISDRSGPNATVSLLAELRTNAARAADPLILAALHLFVAQMEAMRKLTAGAHRHVRLAQETLKSVPNCWLSAIAENIEVALATLRADFTDALARSPTVIDLALRSGAKYLLATAQGNFGTLLFLTGDYQNALHQQEQAAKAFPQHSDNYIGSLDNLARTKLAQEQFDECATLLATIDLESNFLGSKTSFVYRHALLTRVDFLSRLGRLDEALRHVETVIELAEESADSMLFHTGVLTKAELLVATGGMKDVAATIDPIAVTIGSQPPDVYALYQRVIARAVSREGNSTDAKRHFERARRIYSVLNYKSALAELERSVEAATPDPNAAHVAVEPQQHGSGGHIVQQLAALILHAQRPELLARELVDLLWSTRSVLTATAIHRKADGPDEIYAHAGCEESDSSVEKRCLALGSFRGGTVRDRRFVAAERGSDRDI